MNPYERLFELAPVAFHELDREGKIRRVNEAECQILGRSKSELIGLPVWELAIDREKGIVERSVKTKLEGDRPPDTRITRNYVKGDTNKTVPVQISDAILRDDNGNIDGILSVIEDLSTIFSFEYLLHDPNSLCLYAIEACHEKIAVTCKDRRGRITHANPRFRELVGAANTDDLTGMSDWKLYPQKHARKYRDDDQAVMTSGRVWQLIETHAPKGSTARLVQAIKIPSRDASGNPTGVQVIFWDLEDRDEVLPCIDKALHQFQTEWRTLIEDSSAGLYRSSLQGRILEANDRLASIFGYQSAEELLHIDDIASELYVDPKDRQSLLEDLSQPGSIAIRIERLKKKGGETFWASDTARAVFDQNSLSPVYLVGAIQDITPLKQAEERYSKLFEEANDLMYTHDLEGNFTSMNRRARDVCGVELNDVNNRHISEFVKGVWLDIAMSQVRRKIEDEDLEGTEYSLQFRPPGRNPVFLELSTSLVRDSQGNPVEIQGIARDITRSRQRWAEAKESSRQETLAVVGSTLAHEAKQPITTVEGQLRILLGKEGIKDDPDTCKLIEGVIAECSSGNERIESYIAEFRDPEKPKRQECLRGCLTQVKSIYQKTYPQDVEFLQDPNGRDRIPFVEMRRMFFLAGAINLWDNAVKYSSEPRRVWFETEFDEARFKVIARLCNSGRFSPEQLGLLENLGGQTGSFQGFHEFQGCGVGIVNAFSLITTLNDGRLVFDNTERGATVEISFEPSLNPKPCGFCELINSFLTSFAELDVDPATISFVLNGTQILLGKDWAEGVLVDDCTVVCDKAAMTCGVQQWVGARFSESTVPSATIRVDGDVTASTISIEVQIPALPVQINERRLARAVSLFQHVGSGAISFSGCEKDEKPLTLTVKQ